MYILKKHLDNLSKCESSNCSKLFLDCFTFEMEIKLRKFYITLMGNIYKSSVSISIPIKNQFRLTNIIFFNCFIIHLHK